MRIALVADCHVGNHGRLGGAFEAGMNARCRLSVEVLGRAYEAAQAAQADVFVIAGDLFDTVKPTPQVIAAVQAALTGKLPVHVLMGNHDLVSNAPGDHALGPLAAVSNVTIIERASWVGCPDAVLAYVPFQPGPAKEWFPGAAQQALGMGAAEARKGGKPCVLVTHLGIESPNTPTFLRGAADSLPVAVFAETASKYSLQLIAAGNWHEHAVYPVRMKEDAASICQIGSLCPTGFDNPGLQGYGKLVVWDTRKAGMEVSEVAGPRFLKYPLESGGISSLVKYVNQRGDDTACSLFVEVEAAADQLSVVRETLSALRQWNVRGEVYVQQASRLDLAEMAKAARPQLTLDAAIDEWVSEQELGGLSRETVVAAIRKYIGIA